MIVGFPKTYRADAERIMRSVFSEQIRTNLVTGFKIYRNLPETSVVSWASPGDMWAYMRQFEKNETEFEGKRLWFSVSKSPAERVTSSAMGAAKRMLEKVVLEAKILLPITTEWKIRTSYVGLHPCVRFDDVDEQYEILMTGILAAGIGLSKDVLLARLQAEKVAVR